MKFKHFCKKAWKKFMVFWREVGNFFTNLLCPILSILAATAELLQLPSNAIQALKKAEEWCYQACGTKKIIDGMVEGIDKVVEKNDNCDCEECKGE
jgi:hypothetical protein